MYRTKRVLVGGLAAATLAAAGGSAVTAHAQPGSVMAATVQIAIHEHGTAPTSAVASNQASSGRFTIELALTPFGPGGTARNYPDPGTTRQVSGQTQNTFTGVDTLTSKGSTLQLAFSGVEVPINRKLEHGSTVVGPAADHGAWRIKAATGIYKGWTGGGIWAAIVDGYGRLKPYSVEWDGNITR